ncbi:ead/Ea22-like family protein [Salmonella enterica]|nr:ead/Ea22-like family protein [Salmonella enterica subsp. diarizonae]EBU2201748.1 ead/Ea22-like family protein [Salmonella enterica]EDT1449517.1 ead/Ea22-like family protein [Salmonella enterica subsp. diarizonae]EDV5323522.1 ead/Ea22-like family protein [Salmonella enterica subsp. arizonae]EEH8272041.1 ead/Ea22-like family protein [Salmonella enterica]
MSNIDKQALRQIAESVDREEWDVLDNGDADYQVIVSGSLERGATYRSYQPVTNEISNKKIAAFIAAFNPKVALALLDENLQLQREKDAIEAVALALRDDMRQAREQLEAAEKRNAEQQRSLDHRKFLLLSADEVQRDFAEALGCAGDNESIMEAIDDLKQHIAELETKLETADRLQDSAFRDGLKAGFSYGQTDDQSGFAQCMSVYSTRTDIGVKVE